MRCLLIGEDGSRLHRLERIFRENGWHIFNARSATAVLAGSSQNVDLAILSITTSQGPMEFEIDATRRALPSAIILVLGEFSVDSRMRALALGAADFIEHDVSNKLLVARVEALMRLRKGHTMQLLEAGDLRIDLKRRRVSDHNRDLTFSQKEFELLALLIRHLGSTLRRSELIERLWDTGAQAEDNALEVQISRLRRKLPASSRCRIVTIRGVGYRLDVLDLEHQD